MRMLLFDARGYDRAAFSAVTTAHEVAFQEAKLTATTAPLAHGFEVVCAFVNDHLDADVLERLKSVGVRLLALRSAGFNNVDLVAAQRLELPVVRVPAYSPEAVAEMAVTLVLALNRKVHRAYARVRELNFSLEGLVGFNLAGKTVGLMGTGRIGAVAARIFSGFGCDVLAYDPVVNDRVAALPRVRYVGLDELYAQSHVLSLHLPLTQGTHHLIDAKSLGQMRRGVMLINTGRGGLIDSRALVDGLKSGQVGAAGLDVYEEEEGLFFDDHSGDVLQDDVMARLLTFPNVLITSHQAFLTEEALANIASITLASVDALAQGKPLTNQVLESRKFYDSCAR